MNDASGTKRQIVCGATNYKAGDKVPLAPSRCEVAERNRDSKKQTPRRRIGGNALQRNRARPRFGRRRSPHFRSPEAKVGAPISDLFPSDTILDVEVTPNRGDLLSHFGLAREIAALTGKKLKSTPDEAKVPIKKTGATISATHECPFFSAQDYNVQVSSQPSPQWLRAKIESVGIRSINNIVDISNFVMLELGQPTHAFDADKLKGGINVRLARG